MTGWQVHVPPPPGALRLAGLVLVVMGAAVLFSAFARFVLEGRGTPAPVAPTQHLVVGGLYRHVRNPMYLAVTAIIVGQALLLGRLELLAYAALFLATTAAFARWYEEPALQHQYGAEYEGYRRAVPGWWPRLRPWKSPEEAEAPRHRSEPTDRPPAAQALLARVWRCERSSGRDAWAEPDWRRPSVSTLSSALIEDAKVGVRLKISALWIALLFLYAYGDIFGFFKPGQIEDIVSGEISGIDITETFLFAISVYIAIASVMVFLSLVLRPRINRWTNIVLPILYIVSIVASAIGESAYFWFLSIVESALLLLIIWYAWTWPRLEANHRN
jgi:protein-S-isoprenylcysteine O-methyltransferase Ste14